MILYDYLLQFYVNYIGYFNILGYILYKRHVETLKYHSSRIHPILLPGSTWTAKKKFKLLFPGGAAAPPDPPLKSAWRPPCLTGQDTGLEKKV